MGEFKKKQKQILNLLLATNNSLTISKR